MSSSLLPPLPAEAPASVPPPVQRQALLADASLLLASAPSLDVGLGHVCRRAVMDFVDLCAVELLTPDGQGLQRAALAVAAEVPPGDATVLAERPAPPPGLPTLPLRVLTSARAELASPAGDEVPAALARTPAQWEVLRRLALTSALCAPLQARGRVWGLLWLATGRGSGRQLGPLDVELAENLAQRVALAMEQDARLRQAQESARLCQALSDHAPVGLAVLDAELRVLHLNPALGAWLGLGTREATGQPATTLLPELVPALRRVLDTGRPENGVSLALPPEGPLAAPEAHGDLYPLPGEDGAPAAVGLMVSAVPAAGPNPDAERLHLLARATNDVIWDWDLRSGRLQWNSALHTVFGYTADPAQAQLSWWTEHLHPEDRERAERTLLEAVTQGEECWTCEYRFRRADGTYAVVLDRGYLARDTSGHAFRMLGTMLDITERTRRSEEREALVGALERERQRLTTVLEQLPIGVTIAEAPGGKQILGNRRLEEILGPPLELAPDVAHYGARLAFHADGSPYAPEDFPLARAVLRGETVVSESMDVLRSDGTLVATQVCAAPLLDAGGERFGAVATTEDVSERRALEKERLELLARAEAARAEAVGQRERLETLAAERESQQHWLEAVLDRAPFPLLLLEPETARVRFANRAAEGYGGGQALVQGTVEDARAPGPCKEFTAAQVPFDQLPVVRAARGEALRGTLVHWSAGTRMRTLMAHSASCEAAHGQPAAVLLAFQDVTALRRAEARLGRAVQARDAFLVVAAHELRTPLTALKLSVQKLATTGRALVGPVEARETLRHRLEATDRQVRRMERLIHQLFDITQLDRRRLQLTVSEVDLAQLARDAAVRFADEAQRAGCTLTVSAATPVVGWWDGGRLEQVLDNLLSNALRFGAGQPVTLSVSTEGGLARLTVTDHGIGIPQEAQPRIFERFERAVSERHYGGLGLGLWVTREIIRAHHGSIAVHSAPGAGATFTVTLPQTRPASVPEAPPPV